MIGLFWRRKPIADRPAKKTGWPLVRWVLVRVVAVALALEIVYLVAANIVLATKLPIRLVESTEDLKLKYGSAYSLYPGHVLARDLILRAKDHNVEFEVTVDTVAVDISITDLFKKQFHATSVKTTGTVYKMRHHVFAVGTKGPRLAAYPSIEGMPDPPLYREPESPPLRNEEYNLWGIHLEDVHAEIREVWILEYRYTGPGLATGRFHLQPARWFEVGPAALELRGGVLSVAEKPVSERTAGRIDCYAAHTDVENVTGLAVLHDVSVKVHLGLEGTDLSFANVYTEPTLGAHVMGQGSGRIDIEMEKATLVPGSTFEFRARPFDFRKDKVHFGGPVDVALQIGPKDAPDGVLAELRSPELIGAIRDKETASPSVHGLLARVTVEPRDIRQDLKVTGTEVAVKKFDAPSLAWFDPLLPQVAGKPKLNGSALVSGHFVQTKTRGIDGDVKASFERLRVGLEDVAFQSDSGAISASVKSSPKGNGRFAVNGLELEVKNLSMNKGKGNTPPLSAKVTGQNVEVDDVSPFAAHGVLRAHGDRADALLPLVVDPAFVRSLASFAFQLDSLDARAAFRTSPALQRVELMDVRSGKMTAQGLWQKTSQGKPEGAFLVSGGDLNLGVKLQNEKTDVKIFASRDWLTEQLAKLDRDGTAKK